MDNPIQSALADDGTVTVTVAGEIDYSNADDVSDGIRQALDMWQPPALRVDLRKATFIDSTGLGALIEGYRAATESGSGYAVVNPTDSFRRVLTVTGLCDLFGLAEPEPAARRTTEATGA